MSLIVVLLLLFLFLLPLSELVTDASHLTREIQSIGTPKSRTEALSENRDDTERCRIEVSALSEEISICYRADKITADKITTVRLLSGERDDTP